MNIKKCGFCGNWSGAAGSLDDCCEVCNEILDYKSHYRLSQRVEKSEEKAVLFYHIQENDSLFTKIIRRIAGSIYFAVMGIVSFIVWLVAMLPG